MREKFLHFIFLFSFNFVSAQVPYTPDSLLSQISVFQWTGNNGLKSNNITSSIQASTGFIWITTYNGIMRFDGNKVDVYDRVSIPFLNTDSFYEVAESSSGKLYFASQGSGIAAYDSGSFSPLLPLDTILPNSIRCLLVENDSSIYAGSNGNGIYHIRNGKAYKLQHEWLDNVTVLDIVKDENGQLWIATDGNGLVNYDGFAFKRVTTENGLLSNKINCLGLGINNKLLIGTFMGFNSMNIYGGELFNAFKNIQINHFYNDEFNRTWVATEKGLGRIDWNKNKIELANEENDFPYIRLNWLSPDREGSIWASTGRDGLLQIKKTAITSYSSIHGLSNDRVNVVYQENENTYLIGSDLGQVDLVVDGEVSNFHITTNLNKAGIRDIYRHPNGDYWIASYQGLLKISGSSEKLYTTEDGLSSVELRRIVSDNNGNLWIATRSGGVIKFDGKKVVANYDTNNGLKSDFILALEKDSEGSFYAGTHSGGISIISKEGDVQSYPITENDLGIVVFNIHVIAPKEAWVVSNKEIYYFKNGKYIPMEVKNKLSGITYYDWLEDDKGNAWITSNLGVLKISKAELDLFKTNELHLVDFETYDNHTGMKSKECSGATHSIVANNGSLWIPTVAGVSIIHPNHIQKNNVLPQVYVTSLTVDDDTTFYKNNIEIAPGKTRYLINFTALSYLAPSKVQFKFKLEGFDPDWRYASGTRQVEYTNLPPNSYEFKVQSCNNDGVWNEQGANISFVVKPFFHQTWWFYLLIGITLFLFAYLLYKWRISAVEKSNKELRKVNSELDRFVYSASHDLRAPLSSILGIVSLMRMDKESSLESYLDKIENSIIKLDVFITDIINFSRNARLEFDYEIVDFDRLLAETIEDLKYLTDINQVVISSEIKADNLFYSDYKRISIILKNLISNSLRYYDKGKEKNCLNISVDVNTKRAQVIVEDNGIGIKENHLGKIYDMFYRATENNQGSGIGLYIVQETIEKLGGNIKVSSQYGEGTKFVFELENKA